ncbi:hypothetical protein PINS_up016420 [Pythium insidiosum]|nr:hypothetical protein PINS_up016420 [Pythium insidiosum]
MSYHLEDDTLWRALDERMIADLPYAQPSVPLSPPDVAACTEREHTWTTRLRGLITSQRRENGLATKWSDELSFFLMPALMSYEMERVYGIAQLENDLFQQTIKRFVPEGHTFQGVPLSFTCSPVKAVDAQCALQGIEENAVARQILELHKRGSVFGLAIRCFAYPENVFVVWVMLAATYQSST